MKFEQSWFNKEKRLRKFFCHPIWNWILVITTIGLLVLTYCLVHSASNTLKLGSDSQRIANRAWMGLDSISVSNKDSQINVGETMLLHFTNHGNTPAYCCTVSVHINFDYFLKESGKSELSPVPADTLFCRYVGEIAPSQKFTQLVWLPESISKFMCDSINTTDHNSRLIIRGKIEFEDYQLLWNRLTFYYFYDGKSRSFQLWKQVMEGPCMLADSDTAIYRQYPKYDYETPKKFKSN